MLTNGTGKIITVTNTTDVLAGVVYADQSGLQGPVDYAQLKLGGYTIDSQGVSCRPCKATSNLRANQPSSTPIGL